MSGEHEIDVSAVRMKDFEAIEPRAGWDKRIIAQPGKVTLLVVKIEPGSRCLA